MSRYRFTTDGPQGSTLEYKYGTGMCELYFTQVQMIANDFDQLKNESSKGLLRPSLE
jgi:hypothetical protein